MMRRHGILLRAEWDQEQTTADPALHSFGNQEPSLRMAFFLRLESANDCRFRL
jgi:hypothetical protein